MYERILTTSTNPVVRLFLFLAAVIIYNLWKFYNLLVKVEVTFKGFVFSLFLSRFDVEHIQFCKKRMKEVFTSIPDLKEIA